MNCKAETAMSACNSPFLPFRGVFAGGISVSVASVPKKERRDDNRGLRKKSLVLSAKSIQLITLYIDESGHTSLVCEHGHDNLRASCAEGRQPPRVLLNVSDIHDGPCCDRCAAEPPGNRKSRKCRRRRAGTSDHADRRGSNFVEPNPTVAPLSRPSRRFA